MERELSEVKIGALCWNQYTDWPALLQAGIRADGLGYDSLWTWDHVYPIVGDSHGPNYEGWLTITAWAQATKRVRIGLMVGANTFRAPTLTAKMATTLDHISGGRAILGIGGASFEEEHEDFGLEFGSGFPERLRWLGEALPIMRGMLDGTEPTAAGPHYHGKDTRNLPAPIQAHLPICIGGGGEQVTLKLVAKYGDMNNIGGSVEDMRRKEEVLLRHCETVAGSRGDRADDGCRHGVHPRRPRGGRAPVPCSLRAKPRRAALGGSAVRDARGCGREAGAQGRARLPAPDRGHPGQLRRGVDDPVRDRGQTAAREDVAVPARGRSDLAPLARLFLRARLGMALRPEPADLRAVPARRHVTPATPATARCVLEHPAAAVVGADPEAIGPPRGNRPGQRRDHARQRFADGVVDRVAMPDRAAMVARHELDPRRLPQDGIHGVQRALVRDRCSTSASHTARTAARVRCTRAS